MKALSADPLYLTATGRLARRLRHEYRMTQLGRGKKGWEAMNVLSLNDWLQVQWSESWPEETPAHLYCRLRHFRDLMKDSPPPASFPTDFQLCRMLDDTYATMIRHGLRPDAGLPSTPLVEWRRRLCGFFKDRLTSTGCFHPAELPNRIAQHIDADALNCPASVVVSGFDFPSPIEANLFHVLGKRSVLSTMPFPERIPERLESVTLPSPDEEISYLLDRIVRDARTTPLHRIGVVVPNLDAYSDALAKGLETITGGAPPPGAAWYNISLGKTVLSFPLIMASLFPLQTALEGMTRENLLALFLSPYYAWGPAPAISRADLVWRRSLSESGLKELLACLLEKAPETMKALDGQKLRSLAKFFGANFSVKRPLPLWLDELEKLWSSLGFPVLSDETDTLAFRRLNDILTRMRDQLAGVAVNGYDFYSWIHFLLSIEISQTAAPEEAGIQILGMIESRGHDFDRLYVLGMSSRSLPQPVRPLPLLDTEERKTVLGGTPESQYVFAEKSFQRLLSSSPIVTLLRPEQVDREPVPPSPFWPGAETKASVDLWNNPGPVWIRARWLRSAFEGIKTDGSERVRLPGTIPTQEREDPGMRKSRRLPLPLTASVSDVEKAVACPCLFFLAVILRIEPLLDPLTHLFHLQRGERLHRVLSAFTREVRKRNLSLDAERSEALILLAACADRSLKDVIAQPRWTVERRLWLEEGGLLLKWLDLEAENRSKGWAVLAEEIPFNDLSISGLPFTVNGRMDRIDVHPDKGLICWDYKTGTHPGKSDVLSRLTAPQLPLYLMALLNGSAPDFERLDETTPLSAGYLQLKSPSDIRPTIIGGEDVDWKNPLAEWGRLFIRTGAVLSRGDFPSEPYPFSRLDRADEVCRTCPYRILCERGLNPDRMDGEGADLL
jgi:ATP-dependent helicase/nuclease subunit B